MGAIGSSEQEPVFRNQDELVDWIVQRLEQPDAAPAAVTADLEEEPTPRNDGERLEWIMRRLNKPSETPMVSPWTGNPDDFNAVEQPSRLDAQAMVPIYEKVGFAPNGDAWGMADWQTQIVASLPRDPAAKIRVFARNRFPNMLPDESLARYGVIGDRIFYIDRDGSAKWEEPTFSTAFSDPARYLGAQAGPNLALVGAGMGGVILGVPGAAIGAGISDAARQYLAANLANEQLSAPQRAFYLGMETAAGGAGRYAADRLVRAMTQQRPGWANAVSPIAQWGVRKVPNDAAFKASRAIQGRWVEPEEPNESSESWFAVP